MQCKWEEAKKDEIAHYMGYLVFHDTQDDDTKDELKRKHIVDGQQRLATISLLFLAGIHYLKEHGGSPEQVKILKDRYLQYDDALIVNKPKIKIWLNKTDKEIYTALVKDLGEKKQKKNLSAIEESYQFFYEKIQKELKDSRTPQADVIKFLESAADILTFSVMEAEDEQEIFNLFETLNARGLSLSAADLLKNHIVKITTRDKKTGEDFDEIIDIWNTLEEETDKNLLDFIHTYWGATGENKTKKKLYTSFKETITSYDKAYELLTNLQRYLPFYQALSSVDDAFWDDADYKEIKPYIADTIVLGYKQQKSIFMASQLYLDSHYFPDVCRLITICMVRYLTICNKNPNQLESAFKHLVSWFKQIGSGQENFSKELLVKKLKSLGLYPADDEIRSALSNRLFKQTSTPTYLLYRLGYDNAEAYRYFQAKTLNLEHILPKKEALNKPELAFNFGNLTLLERKTNRQLGTKSFAAKLDFFKNDSTFKLNKNYFSSRSAENSWDETAIQQRCDTLASLLINRWSLQ